MKILWLSHFVPYPPAGGMRQRSYNLLRRAAMRHDVDLVAFNQRSLLPSDEDVEEARRALQGVCADVRVFPIPADRARSRWRWGWVACAGIVRPTPYHVNWLRSGTLHREMRRRAEGAAYDLIHADTLGMVPYASAFPGASLVVNHHNVESHMMARRAAQERNSLLRLYLSRDAGKLERLERGLARRGVVNLTVSEEDAHRLRKVHRGARTTVVENGVDVEYFRPGRSLGRNGRGLLFTGQLSWYANRDAVRFLLSELWPRLAATGGDRRLTLAGRAPPPEALDAARRDPRIAITGAVDDIRPYFDESSIYICPIRTGGGTRLKVLDAMAMGLPMVATRIAVEGLGLAEEEHFLRAETTEEFVAQVRRLEGDPQLRCRLASTGRALVERRYSWDVVGEHLEAGYRASRAHSGVSEGVLTR